MFAPVIDDSTPRPERDVGIVERDFPANCSVMQARFDAVIVDDGQDVRSTWWPVVQRLLRDPNNGHLWVCAIGQGVVANEVSEARDGVERRLELEQDERIDAGENAASVAADYGLSKAEVEQAVVYERAA